MQTREQANDTESSLPSVNRKYPWTLTHSFYAVMGGFVLHDPYIPSSPDNPDRYLPAWQLHGVLTPAGVRFIMKHAPLLVPDLPVEDIRDRSKADWLGKALLVCQLIWFLLTCINRGVEGLPLSLLEISTIAHALCSLLTYAVWWRKPKDVSHSTVIVSAGVSPDLTEAQRIGAWMSMASSANQYFLGGILKLNYRSEMDHFKPHTSTRSSEVDRAGPEDIEPSQTTPLIQDPDNQSPVSPTFSLKELEEVTFCPSIRGSARTWKAKLIFGVNTLPWYAKRIPHAKLDLEKHETIKEMQIRTGMVDSEIKAMDLRLDLASRAGKQYSLSPPTIRVRYVVPFASLQAFTDTQQYDLKGICRTALLASGLGAVYGLPHLIALSVKFPTEIEGTLWRLATVIVAALGLVLGTMTVVLMGIAMLLGDWVHSAYNINLGEQKFITRMKTFFERWVVSLGAFLYISSSAYLLAETVRELFALPPEAFKLPSWSNYWPHLS